MTAARFDGIRIICLVLFTVIMAVSPSVAAQGPEDNLSAFMQLAASDIRAKTTEIISGSMNFTAEEGSAFWPIYRKYEYEWGAITDQMIELLKVYSASRRNLDDAKAKDLADRLFKIDAQKVAVNKKYFKEFSKVLPAPRVVQFFQLSRRIDLLVNLRIAATLPMIGEDW